MATRPTQKGNDSMRLTKKQIEVFESMVKDRKKLRLHPDGSATLGTSHSMTRLHHATWRSLQPLIVESKRMKRGTIEFRMTDEAREALREAEAGNFRHYFAVGPGGAFESPSFHGISLAVRDHRKELGKRGSVKIYGSNRKARYDGEAGKLIGEGLKLIGTR